MDLYLYSRYSSLNVGKRYFSSKSNYLSYDWTSSKNWTKNNPTLVYILSDSDYELSVFDRNIKWNILRIKPFEENEQHDIEYVVDSVANFLSELILSKLIYADRISFSGMGLCGEIALLLSGKFNPGLCVTKDVDIKNFTNNYTSKFQNDKNLWESILTQSTFCYSTKDQTKHVNEVLGSFDIFNKNVRLFEHKDYTTRRICSFLGYPDIDDPLCTTAVDKAKNIQEKITSNINLRLNSRPSYMIIDDFDFSIDPFKDRSWRFWFQNFSWLPEHLKSLSNEDAKTSFSFIFKKWLEFIYRKGINSEFLYHDHSLALRPIYLIQCQNFMSPDVKQLVHQHLVDIAALLCSPIEDNALSNHSYDQAITLFTLSDYFKDLDESKGWRNLAIQRIKRELSYAFTADGVHVENSPAYHHGMISNLFKSLSYVYELTRDDFIKNHLQSLSGCVPFLKWITRPDSTLPPIGDSEEKIVNDRLARKLNPVEYETAPKGLRIFGEGYAIWREEGNSVYATMKSCLSGRFHRHDDDCSITLWVEGVNLIIDSGLLFYKEKDPERIWVRSPKGHSGFEIEGFSPSRDLFNPNSDRSKVIKVNNNTAKGFMGMYPEHSASRTVEYNDKKFILIDKFDQKCLDDGIKINWVIDGRWEIKKYSTRLQFDDNCNNSWSLEFEEDQVSEITISKSFASEVRNQKKPATLIQIKPNCEVFNTVIFLYSMLN